MQILGMEWQYGNLTAQTASNVNLGDFDNYIISNLDFKRYVRYVDDIIIISNDKNKLIEALPNIENKLLETNQKMNSKKTKIDTAFHGVPFLGKISYPYGYQKPNKQSIIRVNQRAKVIQYEDKANVLAKTNSQIGTLKNYNCIRLIKNYLELLPDKAKAVVKYNNEEMKFY